MNAAATLLSMLLLLLSVPIFMVFGLGSASVAILGMDLHGPHLFRSPLDR